MEVLPEFKAEQRVRELTDPVQIIAVLLYLIKKTCDDRALVLHYAELADEPIERVMELIKRELSAQIEVARPPSGKRLSPALSPESSVPALRGLQ